MLYLIISLMLCTLSVGANPLKENRIVGGQEAKIKDFPYQVALVQNGELLCGGSLIAINWVLTAAHCLYDSNEITVKVGSDKWAEGGADHKVKERISHPSYKMPYGYKHDFDYALLELEQPVRLSNKVQLIKLPRKGEKLEVGTMLNVSGWGDAAGWDGSGPSKVLMSVTIPTVNEDICQNTYPHKITNRMFCTGFYGEGLKDSCQGDSGGPVVHEGVQYGIVSWGTECGLKFYPGVNAKVSAERDWIHEITGV